MYMYVKRFPGQKQCFYGAREREREGRVAQSVNEEGERKVYPIDLFVDELAARGGKKELILLFKKVFSPSQLLPSFFPSSSPFSSYILILLSELFLGGEKAGRGGGARQQ